MRTHAQSLKYNTHMQLKKFYAISVILKPIISVIKIQSCRDEERDTSMQLHNKYVTF